MKVSPPLILAGAFMVMGIISLAALIGYRPVNRSTALRLQPLGVAPPFSLTDSRNQVFSHEDLKGKIWVADFFFSTCAGPCPLMSANMKTLQDRFRGRADLRLVSFSVNPVYDTPKILEQYAAKLKADTRRWHFLTGSEEDILRISAEGFKLGDPEILYRHSQKFVLVDRGGLIRGYYDGTDKQAVANLAADIVALR